MKRVISTKNHSIVQMSNMVSNLQEKFNSPSKVEFYVWRYRSSDPPKPTYRIYIESLSSSIREVDSWMKFQNKYFRLMERKDA